MDYCQYYTFLVFGLLSLYFNFSKAYVDPEHGKTTSILNIQKKTIFIKTSHAPPFLDCRRMDGGPYYFQRVNERLYRCMHDGPSATFECPEKFLIPDWFDIADTQPCLCLLVLTETGEETRVCPKDPFVNQRTTANPLSATPEPGKIGDRGKKEDQFIKLE